MLVSKTIICTRCGCLVEVADKSTARYCEDCRKKIWSETLTKINQDHAPKIYCTQCGNQILPNKTQMYRRRRLCPDCYGPLRSPHRGFMIKFGDALRARLESEGWPVYLYSDDYSGEDDIFSEYDCKNSRRIAFGVCVKQLGYQKISRKHYKKVN